MSQMHPSQWSAFHSAYWSAQIASWGLAVVALAGIGAGAVLPNYPAKALSFGASLGACALASPQRRSARRLAGHVRDIEDLSDAGFQQFAASVLKAVAMPVTPIAHDAVNVTAVEDLPRYNASEVAEAHHTLITGPTGSGKSVLVQWLVSRYFKDAETLVYDSDAGPHEWPGFKVIGRGGDFVQISGAMVEDLKLLEQRCEARGQGKAIGPEVVRVCEEFPAVAAELSEIIGGKKSSAAASWMKRLARRGRKYRIKMILVTQETSVAAMGIEGEGGVRKAFTIIYLGASALEVASRLKDQAFHQYLQRCDRPCLVDHRGRYYVCDIPDLSVQSAPRPPIRPEMPRNPISDVRNRLEMLLDKTPNPHPINAEIISDDPKNPEKLRQEIAEMKRLKMTQTQIIFSIWKAKPGDSERYKSALQQYKDITGE